jgi:hypothetical protein
VVNKRVATARGVALALVATTAAGLAPFARADDAALRSELLHMARVYAHDQHGLSGGNLPALATKMDTDMRVEQAVIRTVQPSSADGRAAKSLILQGLGTYIKTLEGVSHQSLQKTVAGTQTFIQLWKLARTKMGLP